MRRVFLALTGLLVLGLAACQSPGKPSETGAAPPPDEDVLTYAESSAGYVVLDQFRDVLGGGVVDLMLTGQDQRHFRNAAGEALERKAEGQKASWYNPLSGRGGQFTVISVFRGPDGRPCKRLTQKVLAGGRAHVVQSVACKRGDESWSGFES